ncbi:MAG: hypothetical protein Q7S79_00110 [bacterium]|nr:hypothetical protein [bacterium]
MNTRIFLILTLVFSLLQGPLLPSVFVEGILIVLFLFEKGLKRAMPFIFLAGIIFDLFQSRTIGLTSLIFVLGAGVIWYLRSYISLQRGVFLTLGALSINLARIHFAYHAPLFSLSPVVVLILGLLIFNVLKPIISGGREFEI